jgi:hypothetical protein
LERLAGTPGLISQPKILINPGKRLCVDANLVADASAFFILHADRFVM